MTDDRPSLGTLVAGITNELSTLVRNEIELAKAEARESMKRGASGGALIAVAVALLAMVWLLITFALVYVLIEVADLPAWASFLIIAGVYLVIAAIIIAIAVAQLKKARGPERAKAEMQRTKQIVESLPPNTPPVPDSVRTSMNSDAAKV
jgi:protein-S-isoprenylcysteine O-methyltransferase Ste14